MKFLSTQTGVAYTATGAGGVSTTNLAATGTFTITTINVGSGSNTATALINANQQATSGNVNTDSNQLSLRTTRWNGTSALGEDYVIYARRRTTIAGDLYLSLSDDVEVAGYVNASTDVQVGARSLPLGGLANGYAQITAASTTVASTTVTDIAGLAVTVTTAANRRIKITALVHEASSIANDRALVYIREGSTTLSFYQGPQLVTAASSYTHMFSTVLVAPTAGSHTYKVSHSRLSGTGTITPTGATTGPAYILVEDLGPST